MEGGGPILKLIVEKINREEQQTLEFQPGSLVKIGRVVRGNTLAVKDPAISSKHLSIEFVSGEWILFDLDSSNGTFVNGNVIDAGSSIKLRNGDTIKIGELTTIKVWIEVRNVENTLRRNPRRRAVKDPEQNTVGISGTRSRRRGDLASTVGKKELGLGLKDPEQNTVGISGTRSRRRGDLASTVGKKELGLGLKDPEQNTVGISGTRSRRGGDLASTVGKKELGLGLAVVGEVGVRRGKGRPRKVVAQTDDSQESFQAVVEVGNFDNDGPIKSDQTGQLSKRTTRTSKNEQKTKSSLLPPLCSTVVCSTLEEEEGVPAEIVEKKTRVEGKRRRKADDDPPLKVRNEAFAENCIVKDSQFGKEDDETCGDTVGNQMDVQSAEEEVPDLEKMTLGQWFHYLEVYLPKQINDAAEEMISNMKAKAAKSYEFLLQQKNEKQKG